MTEGVKTEAVLSVTPDTNTIIKKGFWAWLKSYIKSWFDWTGEHKTATVFFVFTILSTILTGIAFYRSQSTFKNSQDRIVENQTSQIDSIKAVILSMHKNAKTAFITNDSTLQKLISDSLLVKIPNLNNLQQAELNKYIKAIFVTSVSELAYKDWIKELNSTLSQKEISQIQIESKTLLDLEFIKIQNEYETLTLWAGILTVVFLIFSFYSLFKADDLVKQGREGRDKLNEHRDEAIKLNKESRKEYDELKEKIAKFTEDIGELGRKKIKQDAEIKKISEDIAIQGVGYAQNQKLKKEYENLIADIAQARQDILDLQGENHDKSTNVKIDTTDAKQVIVLATDSANPPSETAEEEEHEEENNKEKPGNEEETSNSR